MDKEPTKNIKNMLCPLKDLKDNLNNGSTSISTPVLQSPMARNFKPKVRTGVVNYKIAANIKNCQKKTNRCLVGGGDVPVLKKHLSTSAKKPMTAKNSKFKVHSGNINKRHACCGNDNSKEQHRDFSGGDVKNRCVVFKKSDGYNIDRKNQEKLAIEKSNIIKKKQILNAYTNSTNEVKKPAPFIKNSSFINRQAKQREIDQTNFIFSQKLLQVKASVNSFH